MAGSESGDQWSDSEFEESGFQSSQGLGADEKRTPGGKKESVKNQPYDEALDLSQSMNSELSPAKYPRSAASKYDEALDAGSSMDAKEARARGDGRDAKNAAGPGIVKNKQFDEAYELSGDSAESSVASSERESPSPKKTGPSSSALGASQQGRAGGGIGGAIQGMASGGAAGGGGEVRGSRPGGVGTAGGIGSIGAGAGGAGARQPSLGGAGGGDESSESESDDENSQSGARVEGAYDPDDFKHLNVSSEIKDLFNYITRYKPHDVDLDSTLRCFVPDYIPAVGEMDAFVKVTPPDSSRDDLGLKVLDEPAALQSDPTVLELQLINISKKGHADIVVRSIEDAAKNPQQIDRWIRSVQDELHAHRHAAEVQYKRPMPDIESLMAEWPADFEDALQQLTLPSPDMAMSLEEYARVVCGLMDIPVHANIIESLHVLFSLYTAFKENPHFAARSQEAAAADGPTGAPMGAMMGGGGADIFTLE
uniref:Intraflagellar transport protein 46 homolog n=1 Tax=Rhizochromulina marina TaxID=1034831 RepID=A0A7S2SRL5_9STRA